MNAIFQKTRKMARKRLRKRINKNLLGRDL